MKNSLPTLCYRGPISIALERILDGIRIPFACFFFVAVAIAISASAAADSIEWQVVTTDVKTGKAIENATFNAKLETALFEERINKLISSGKVKRPLVMKKEKPAGDLTKNTAVIVGEREGNAWWGAVDSAWPSKMCNYLQSISIATPKGFLFPERTYLTAAHCPTLIPNRWSVGATWRAKNQSVMVLQKLTTDTPDLPDYQQYYFFPTFLEILSQKAVKPRLDPLRIKQTDLDKIAGDLAQTSPDAFGISVNHASEERMIADISEKDKDSAALAITCDPTSSVDQSWTDFTAKLGASAGKSLYGLAPVGKWCLLREQASGASQGPVYLVRLTPFAVDGSLGDDKKRATAAATVTAPEDKNKPASPGEEAGRRSKSMLEAHPGIRRLLGSTRPSDRFPEILAQAGCKLKGRPLLVACGKIAVPIADTEEDEVVALEKFLREKLLMWDQFDEWRVKNPGEFAVQN